MCCWVTAAWARGAARPAVFVSHSARSLRRCVHAAVATMRLCVTCASLHCAVSSLSTRRAYFPLCLRCLKPSWTKARETRCVGVRWPLRCAALCVRVSLAVRGVLRCLYWARTTPQFSPNTLTRRCCRPCSAARVRAAVSWTAGHGTAPLCALFLGVVVVAVLCVCLPSSASSHY